MEGTLTLGSISPVFEIRDEVQMQFLRSLVRQEGVSRFILKGGLAMRTQMNSSRRTKDIDFDAEHSFSQAAMDAQITRALKAAAATVKLRAVDITREKGLTSRWRLRGKAPEDIDVNFDVEVSKRGVPDGQYVEELPFGIPPRMLRVYSADALAGGKVNALLSPVRSEPRDVYDLSVLIEAGADPSELWAMSLTSAALEQAKEIVEAMVFAIDHQRAVSNLLMYLPADLRQAITAARWEEIQLDVAMGVRHWLDCALQSKKESGEDDGTTTDFAGR